MVKVPFALLRNLLSGKGVWLSERDDILVGIHQQRADAPPNFSGFSFRIESAVAQDLMIRAEGTEDNFEVSVELLKMPADLKLGRFAGLIVYWTVVSRSESELAKDHQETWVFSDNPRLSNQ